jgi:hypothetical protein
LKSHAFVLVLTSAVLLGACGATEPTPINIAGDWAGTIGTSPITMVLGQTGGAVTGTWNQSSTPAIHIIGTVNGTVTGTSFSGTLQYTLNGATCTASVAGAANATAMTWTSGGYATCGGTGFTVSITKK